MNRPMQIAIPEAFPSSGQQMLPQSKLQAISCDNSPECRPTATALPTSQGQPPALQAHHSTTF
ncbi:hypothetical protein SNOG_07483 [Parastagonospora nodorum SN15]|uniref:Uncharacterized protein n=1 Tax=Phaeosphaeria nodorum (strain SN15 / ATCC MYA-4574 / FGSC 10173) TaxID=321614 RepID=Q0UL81_PHANO|nr:hypothetical protein SNOG_07483 [Parastagonospora nodorum SN15]EAT84949.1 hypothetical protein SNOG_07483 [Parastagonospora nodorum SN15]